MPPEEALATVVDSPYTRYPVYRDSLDEIIGILHVRDLFAAMHDLGIAAVRARDRSRARRTSSRRRRTSPRCSPTSGARSSTWRSSSTSTAAWTGSSRSRTCSRRSSARSRTSSTFPTRRSSGSTRRASGSTARTRSTTSTRRSGPSSTRTTSTRWPASSSARSGGRPRSGDAVDRGRRSGSRVLEVEGSRILRLEVEFGVDGNAEARGDEPEAA